MCKNDTSSTPWRGDFAPYRAGVVSPTEIYLDGAATGVTHGATIDALTLYALGIRSNVHRSVSRNGEDSTVAYEEARAALANFIHAPVESIVFTSGTTASINAVARGWGHAACARVRSAGKRPVVVVTQAEHHANYLPWHELMAEWGGELVVLPLTSRSRHSFGEAPGGVLFESESPGSSFQIDLAHLPIPDERHEIILAAVTLSSNVLGPVWGFNNERLTLLREWCRQFSVPLLLDAAQVVAHERISVLELAPDFLAFSAHKMGGPTGIGVLYVAPVRHEEMLPMLFGGSMVRTVALTNVSRSRWREMPYRLEAGTPPLMEAYAWRAVVAAYEQYDMVAIQRHEAGLCARIIEAVSTLPGITIVGDCAAIARMGHLVSFFHESIHAHDLVALLGEAGIMLRAGDHCAHPLTAIWGGWPTVRVSVGAWTTHDEIEVFIAALRRLCATV